MLLNLHIKNMALIDEIDIDFSNNLNILTGETGAGKSIVIDSILLALGGKTPKDFVREDAEYGFVELIFEVDEEIIQRLTKMEIPDLSEGQLIISRKIIGNRSVSKVNGETMTLTKVREIAGMLLDVHTQHEHQSLLIPENHIKILDRYGYERIACFQENVQETYKEFKAIEKEIAKNSMKEEDRIRKMDLMEFEMEEIQSANLQIGEDEELEGLYKRMLNGKNITEGLAVAYGYAANEISETMDRAIREMNVIAPYDEALEGMLETLTTTSELLSDFSRSARNYLDEYNFSEADFMQVENRLNTLNHLKTKYGKTLEDVLAYEKETRGKYEILANQAEYLKRLEGERCQKEKELRIQCEKLSNERKMVAADLSKAITTSLVDLNFLDVRFDMVFERKDAYSSSGFDYAYFVISTNTGESMKPLWQVASGGELSRIMLAMKSQLANTEKIETLIFDEIDVGISGRTAQMVAEKIDQIGKNHQVICITHLPQIAAMANHHYRIEKKVHQGKTITSIEKLNNEQEIHELARLIGGVKITDTVLENAREMKELASKAKVN